jgi:alcohol dehydrogenase class IV
MRSFQHITPALRLISGPESLDRLGRELDRVGSRRAVIFCGGSLAGHDALLQLVRGAMGDRCAGVFAGVRAHSPLATVTAAAQELQRLGADAVVPVGGGSAIVTARAASILLAEQGSVASLSTAIDDTGRMRSPKLLAAKLPQFVVPTTPTTAIVKAGSAVFDPASGRRLALFDPKTRAHAVFLHPALLASAPRALVISAGLNTFSLAMEGLLSRATEPLADALLMHALRLVRRHLAAADDDPTARSELALAAILCGQGTDVSGAGVGTVLGHAIGARHEVENGPVSAILLPHVLRFNAAAAPDGIGRIAASLDLPGLDADARTMRVVDAVRAFAGTLGVALRLRDLGLRREALADIAAHAMEDWFLRGNPRPVRDAGELLGILQDAW